MGLQPKIRETHSFPVLGSRGRSVVWGEHSLTKGSPLWLRGHMGLLPDGLKPVAPNILCLLLSSQALLTTYCVSSLLFSWGQASMDSGPEAQESLTQDEWFVNKQRWRYCHGFKWLLIASFIEIIIMSFPPSLFCLKILSCIDLPCSLLNPWPLFIKCCYMHTCVHICS